MEECGRHRRNRNQTLGYMTTFSELSLDPRVLQAVAESGYNTPTPIQAQAIPHALEGRDVLGIAQTGTGKTAAFVLPMIDTSSQGPRPRAHAAHPGPRADARTGRPGRRAVRQIRRTVKLTKALLIGGVTFGDQDKLIDRGVDVLIATPGRLLDHFERGKLLLTGVQVMVVDEADRMLDMGFIPDIERIFKLTPFTRQTLFFSATMPPEITRLTEAFLHNPVRIEVAPPATAAETIDQCVVTTRPGERHRRSEKREVLRRLIRAEGDSAHQRHHLLQPQDRRRRRGQVAEAPRLQRRADPRRPRPDSCAPRRSTASATASCKFLIASDVAARGLDIPNVSHVFNYDVPLHSEDYVHRIGRTGRAGRSGKSITLCLPHRGEVPRQDRGAGEEDDPGDGEPARQRRRLRSDRGQGAARSRFRPPPAERSRRPAAPREIRSEPRAATEPPADPAPVAPLTAAPERPRGRDGDAPERSRGRGSDAPGQAKSAARSTVPHWRH